MAEQEMIVKYIRNDDGTLNMRIMGELVRCKDCIWFEDANYECGICGFFEEARCATHYCGEGVQKDGDHHE